MAGWIVWIRMDAPDRDTVARRVAIHLAELGTVERIQSQASYEVGQDELAALKRRRIRPDEGA